MMIATACLFCVGACISAQKSELETQPVAAKQDTAKPQAATIAAAGQTVRIMTYNVENFRQNFLAFQVNKTTQPNWPPAALELIARERREDDEENWEVARTITDVSPDIWLLQEGCDKSDLEYFNREFLKGYFETVHVFKTNTDRVQNTAILLKPGFKVLEYKEDYHDEPDTGDVNPLFDKLFARGPGFALVQAPDGSKFWVGTNHAKSKAGDNGVPVTQWRNAEAVRTNQIINELRKAGPKEVFFLGDMNDELGMDQYEKEVGASAIELIGGKGDTALEILTKPLVDRGEISYGGYRRGDHRSFIDHAFATPEAAKWVQSVYVFRGDLADVASDHFPVVVDAVIK
jgi:endonuclease/exonuclease/phosphatase family metal-dependent hydrolase